MGCLEHAQHVHCDEDVDSAITIAIAIAIGLIHMPRVQGQISLQLPCPPLTDTTTDVFH